MEENDDRPDQPLPALDKGEFLAWRSPRTVSENPTSLDNPLWHWLVRTGWSAYRVNDALGGPSAVAINPMWCFDRFGKSETALPDGRVVYIGGEHEDYYDPDFFIYSDVIVVKSDGSVAIFGYPPSSFPPTDFHSATLVDNTIIIIGCLGHPEQRVAGSTPVFRLALDTMHITALPSRGDVPGWIHEHSAALSDDARSIIIKEGEVWHDASRVISENIDSWSLEIASGEWTRLTALDWQRWTMRRVDRKSNRLWNVRQALWHSEHAWLNMDSGWDYDDAPDFEALAALYRLDGDSQLAEDGENTRRYCVYIDGTSVIFTEDRDSVRAIVEGRLSAHRLTALKTKTLEMLERLDATKWEYEEV